jgi:hypothetical protein
MNSQALGPRALLVLSTVILPSALQPGHDLCQQGAPADRLWFLTEGTLPAAAMLLLLHSNTKAAFAERPRVDATKATHQLCSAFVSIPA